MMNVDDCVVIYPGRVGKVFLILGGASLIVFGVFFMPGAPAWQRWFMTLCGESNIAIALVSLLKRRPTLVIGPEGIIDNSSLHAVGFLRWDEIAEVFVYRQMVVGHFLGIVPIDLDKVLARLDARKRFWLKKNAAWMKAPINIPEGSLSISVNAALDEIVRFRPELIR